VKTETTLVIKRTLPEVAPGTTNSPVLKRLLLPQVELALFYDGSDPIHYIAFIELKAGTQRGNHFHKHKFEWIYVLTGEFLLRAEEVETHERQKLTVRGGDLINIRPGVAHVLDIHQSGHAIEFSPARFDQGDIYRYAVR
jgi:mannose-6-phosphate isomerase-like protein (cupin superfamily)